MYIIQVKKGMRLDNWTIRKGSYFSNDGAFFTGNSAKAQIFSTKKAAKKLLADIFADDVIKKFNKNLTFLPV